MTAFLQVLLGLLLQSTGLLLLGLLALWLTRKYGPAVQTLIGRATLSGVTLLLLLAPLSGHIRPMVRVRLDPNPSQAPTFLNHSVGALLAAPSHRRSAASATGTIDTDTPSIEGAPSSAPTTQLSPAFSPPRPPVSGGPLRRNLLRSKEVGSLWLALSSILLLWLAVCQVHLTCLRRTASLITSGPAMTLLTDLTPRPPILLTHPSTHSPFLAGLRRPAIFLPAAYETEFDTIALRAILVHELAHRDRRDNFWTLLARLLTAVLWPQPLLWLLCRRLEQISEDACDEAVLASDCPPRAYADCLLTLAERSQPNHRQRTLTAGVAPFRSSLGRRVQHILSKGTRPMSTVSTHLRLTIAALTIATAIGGVFLVSSAPALSVTGSKPKMVLVKPTEDAKVLDRLSQQFLSAQIQVAEHQSELTIAVSKASFIEQMLKRAQEANTQGQSTDQITSLQNADRDAQSKIRIAQKKLVEDKVDMAALQLQINLVRVRQQATKSQQQAPVSNDAANQLGNARFLAGLTPVQGPGVVVTLTDSKVPSPSGLPAGMALPNLIHDTDINQVVNELKAAGAEAITVNNQRLIVTSAVRSSGTIILINSTPQTSPYVIKAIGESKTLETALNFPSGIASQIKRYDKAMFTALEAAKLTLPAYTGTDKIRYAKPVELGEQAHASRSDAASAGLLAQRSRIAAHLVASQSETDSLRDYLQIMSYQILQKAIKISQSRPPMTIGPDEISPRLKTNQSDIALTEPVAEALSELRRTPQTPAQIASQSHLNPVVAKVQFLHDVHSYELKWRALYSAELNAEADTWRRINADRLIQRQLQSRITDLDKQIRKRNETVPAY